MFKPCVEFFVLHAGLFIQVCVQVYECLQGFIGGFQPFSEAKKKLGFNVLSLKSELILERDTSLELATYCLGTLQNIPL